MNKSRITDGDSNVILSLIDSSINQKKISKDKEDMNGIIKS